MIGEFKRLDNNPIATIEFLDWWNSPIPTVDAVPHLLLPLFEDDWCVRW